MSYQDNFESQEEYFHPDRFRNGRRVIVHTGFNGFDHGKPCWWAENKRGEIVRILKTRCLVEFQDGSREWFELEKVEPVV